MTTGYKKGKRLKSMVENLHFIDMLEKKKYSKPGILEMMKNSLPTSPFIDL